MHNAVESLVITSIRTGNGPTNVCIYYKAGSKSNQRMFSMLTLIEFLFSRILWAQNLSLLTAMIITNSKKRKSNSSWWNLTSRCLPAPSQMQDSLQDVKNLFSLPLQFTGPHFKHAQKKRKGKQKSSSTTFFVIFQTLLHPRNCHETHPDTVKLTTLSIRHELVFHVLNFQLIFIIFCPQLKQQHY